MCRSVEMASDTECFPSPSLSPSSPTSWVLDEPLRVLSASTWPLTDSIDVLPVEASLFTDALSCSRVA